MKIQLIKTPVSKLPNMERFHIEGWYMPLDLICLANAIQDIAEVEIIDGAHLSVNDIINKLNADIVGISFTSLSISNIKPLAQAAKAKGSYVIFGGQTATANPSILFQLPETDAVVVGDGETSLRMLIKNNFHYPEKIPNLIFRNKTSLIRTPTQQVELDRYYQTLDRDTGELNINDYIDSFPQTNTLLNIEANRPTNIFSQKGCPRNCGFCARQDKTYKTRPPQHVVSEIKLLKEKYNIDYLVDISDTWARDSWIKSFYVAYDPSLDINMTVFADIRDITKEKLKIMRQCGVDHVLYGIESGSQKILKAINKSCTQSKILEVLRQTRTCDIKVSASFVVGLMGENESTLSETNKLIEKILNMDGVIPYVNIIMPLPGSPLWNDFIKHPSIKSKYSNSLDYNLDEARQDFLKIYTQTNTNSLAEFRDTINSQVGLKQLVEYAR